MAEQTKFHPALAVNNIKNFIPITLEMEKVQYSSWAELFKIHCRVYKVIDHIIPPKPTLTDKNKEKDDEELWSRLDVVVLQWIYGTISNDLLHTIIETDATAQQTWERLESIFHDNKNQRAWYLENQFKDVQLDDFPNASAYCQELKMLADQLSNVVAPVSNQRLVLQLIAGLNKNYDGVATILQQINPLPPFYEARSRLILEETRKAKRASAAANTVDAVLLTTNSSYDVVRGSGFDPNKQQKPAQRRGQNNWGNNKGKNSGRGRGGHGGPGYRGGQQQQQSSQPQQQQQSCQPQQLPRWQQPPQ